MATTSVFLPGESHGQRSLVGYRAARSRAWLKWLKTQYSKEADVYTTNFYNLVSATQDQRRCKDVLFLPGCRRKALQRRYYLNSALKGEWWPTKASANVWRVPLMSHYQIPVPNPGWAMQPLFPRRPRSLPCWITAYLQYTFLLPLSPPGIGWPFIYTQETPVIPRWLSGRESACQCRTCRRRGFNPWVGKIPWGRKGQPTPVFLPEKFHGQRSLAGYSLWGHSVKHDWAAMRTRSR